MRMNTLAALIGLAISSGAFAQTTGPSSSQSPYVVPTAPGWSVTSIITVGGTAAAPAINADNDYKRVGIPDGLGAYDNGNGTFTVLMNHELGGTAGVVRAHGATGAFVSEWVIRKSDYRVLSGADLATSRLVNKGAGGWTPAVGSEGRAYAFVATGTDKGGAYELPKLGKFSWENSVANPYSGNKTWVYDPSAGTTTQILESDRARFLSPTAPYSLDEESSGVIKITSVLGRADGQRSQLGVMQAHCGIAGEFVEGGQLYVMTAVPEPSSYVLMAGGRWPGPVGLAGAPPSRGALIAGRCKPEGARGPRAPSAQWSRR